MLYSLLFFFVSLSLFGNWSSSSRSIIIYLVLYFLLLMVPRFEHEIRGLKKVYTPGLTNYQIYHNYVRLKCKTPTKLCVKLEQFASRFKNNDRRHLQIRKMAEEVVDRL